MSRAPRNAPLRLHPSQLQVAPQRQRRDLPTYTPPTGLSTPITPSNSHDGYFSRPSTPIEHIFRGQGLFLEEDKTPYGRRHRQDLARAIEDRRGWCLSDPERADIIVLGDFRSQHYSASDFTFTIIPRIQARRPTKPWEWTQNMLVQSFAQIVNAEGAQVHPPKKPIVSKAWVTACIDQGRLLDTVPFEIRCCHEIKPLPAWRPIAAPHPLPIQIAIARAKDPRLQPKARSRSTPTIAHSGQPPAVASNPIEIGQMAAGSAQEPPRPKPAALERANSRSYQPRDLNQIPRQPAITPVTTITRPHQSPPHEKVVNGSPILALPIASEQAVGCNASQPDSSLTMQSIRKQSRADDLQKVAQTAKGLTSSADASSQHYYSSNRLTWTPSPSAPPSVTSVDSASPPTEREDSLQPIVREGMVDVIDLSHCDTDLEDLETDDGSGTHYSV